MSGHIEEKDFKELLNELADVSISNVKNLVIQLGVHKSKCEDADHVQFRERKTYLLDSWLKIDENASWSKLVNAMNKPSVREHEIAEQIRVKYCPSLAQYSISSPLQKRAALTNTRGTTISSSEDDGLPPLQNKGSRETNALSVSFDTSAPLSPTRSSFESTTTDRSSFSSSAAPLSPTRSSFDSTTTARSSFESTVNGKSSFSSSVEETPSAAQTSVYCAAACGECSFQDFLDGIECPRKNEIRTQTGLPYLNTKGMSHFEKELLTGRLLEETSDITISFSQLVNLTAESLTHVKPEKLAKFLRYIDDQKPVRKVQKVPECYSEEFEKAKTADEILRMLRPHYSFFNFGVIESIIVKSRLIPEDDPLHVQKELKNYKDEFAKYCKRRVYECPPVCGEMSQSTVIIHCKCEDNFDIEKYTMASIMMFKAKLIRILRMSTPAHALQLVRVDPGCIRMLWQMPKHMYQHVFPLSELQEKQLHELGVKEFFCRKYKYTASAFMVKLDLNKLATDMKSTEKSLKDLLSKNEHKDKAFFRKFRMAVLQTKVTTKQKSLRLLIGHWRDILDSKKTATLLVRLTPFWDVMHPTLLHDVVQQFGDEGVKEEMEDFMVQLKAFKSRVMLLDIQIACTGRFSLPRDFTSVVKIKVPRETSHFSLQEAERYHNALIQCASLYPSALRFVPAEQRETHHTTLTWNIPNGAIDLMKEFLDDVHFRNCRLSLESITLDDTPVQEFKEYQKGLRLITASREQDVQAVNTLLEAGVDPDSTNQAQMTPLITACDEGYTEVVQVLLKGKADPNLPAEKLTPLHYASYGGYLKIVQLLQENGAHIDPLDEDEHTPLHRACFSGHTAVVQFLLEHGANLLNTCDDGSSVVHQAANNGNCDTVKLLLTKHNAPIQVTDNKGSTALHWVSSRGHVDMMELLIQKDRYLLNMRDYEGLTSLMIAANAEEVDGVKVLVRYRCEVNTQNKDGFTALMMASKQGVAEIVETLIKAKADVNICENTVGWSAVFFAAKEGYLSIIKSLIRAGANVTQKDQNKATALDQARLHDKKDVCALLEPLMGKSPPQVHTLKDMAKRSGEKMTEAFHKLDRWLKSTVKKEEFRQQQAQSSYGELHTQYSALTLQS